MPVNLLYAWANPAFTQRAPLDHTWVTSYDNNAKSYPTVAAVMAAKEDYWFCWGSFHAQGRTAALPSGALGRQAGRKPLARCLVTSNAESAVAFPARGTIFTYGIDGVCHQLANQVLYATGAPGVPQLTVSGANGYRASTAIYGTFGLQHAAWRSKIASCTAAGTAPPPPVASRATRARGPRPTGPTMSTAMPASPPDEFEENVGQVLGAGKLAQAAQLLHLRAQFQTASAAQAHAMLAPTAAELNARNQRFFDDAAKLLSEDDFTAIFGFKPGEGIDLVLDDPTK